MDLRLEEIGFIFSLLFMIIDLEQTLQTCFPSSCGKITNLECSTKIKFLLPNGQKSL